MRFTHAMGVNSLCAPARASLLTGKHSHANGVRDNRTPLDGSQQTFPKLLQAAGYETALIGKWHLKSEPTGFDHYQIMKGQGRYFDCPLKTKGRKDYRVHKGYLTDVITDLAIGWLQRRESGKPFHPRGEGNGYVITFGDKRVYVAGDTENIPEMKELKDIHIAFLPMNLPYTMTPKMVADAARMFKPKFLYPYHYGETDTSKLLKLMEGQKDIEVRIRNMK